MEVGVGIECEDVCESRWSTDVPFLYYEPEYQEPEYCCILSQERWEDL